MAKTLTLGSLSFAGGGSMSRGRLAGLSLTIDEAGPYVVGNTVTLRATWLGMAGETPDDAGFYVAVDGGTEYYIDGSAWGDSGDDLVATLSYTITSQGYPDVPDLSAYGTVLLDTEDLAANVTATGTWITAIAAAGTLGKTLINKPGDNARPEYLAYKDGVLNNRPAILMTTQSKLAVNSDITPVARPQIWGVVIRPIMYFPAVVTGLLLSAGSGTITLASGLPVKAWTGLEYWVLNAAKTAVKSKFTLTADAERGATQLTGTLTTGDIDPTDVLSYNDQAAHRILRTDGATKDFLTHEPFGGGSPKTYGVEITNEATNVVQDTRDLAETPMVILAEYAANGSTNKLRVNGTETTAASTDVSTIGNEWSIGGVSSPPKGTMPGYVARAFILSGDFASLTGGVAALEAALNAYYL